MIVDDRGCSNGFDQRVQLLHLGSFGNRVRDQKIMDQTASKPPTSSTRKSGNYLLFLTDERFNSNQGGGSRTSRSFDSKWKFKQFLTVPLKRVGEEHLACT